MKKPVRKFFESIIERILMVSGWVTSLTILLIIIFLFKEGAGLFNRNSVEEEFVLAINSSNPVRNLTSYEIKEIFDHEITNWQTVGGINEDIIVFRLNDIMDYIENDEQLGEDFEHVPFILDSIIAAHAGMIAFFPKAYIADNFSGAMIDDSKIKLSEFFGGNEWYPTTQPASLFGVLPLVLGTLWVSLAAILFALPFGLAVAIYLAELAGEKTRKILKPVIELLAGIPSVVYGFFGLVVFVPLIQKLFNLPVGETALVGAIVLAIMALPTIITVAEDSIRTVPHSVKEASLALGANHWQTIWRVMIPYSISGIMAAVVLGIGRAIGETMAVLMVTGNSAVIPHTLLTPVRTIPATIAAELGEAPTGGVHYQALFLLGCVLFVITLIISITAEMISMKQIKHSV